MDSQIITVQVIIRSPIDMAWKKWTTPEDIVKWNNASADWCTTRAENDLSVGGKFSYWMEARDGSVGFDFYGTYDKIVQYEVIEYTTGDNRKVSVTFTQLGSETKVVESFETETVNTVELQRGGWQAILNNFKAYCEDDSSFVS